MPGRIVMPNRPPEPSSVASSQSTRIGESGRAIRQLIEIAKRNVVAGVRPPRFAFDFVIDESTKIVTGAPFDDSGRDSALWADLQAKVADLQKKGLLDEAKGKALLDQGRAAMTGPFRSAYQDLIEWQKEDRVNAPEKTSGVGSLPNGRYCLRVRLDPGSTDAPPPTGRILETDEADNIASTKLKLVDDAVSELPGSC